VRKKALVPFHLPIGKDPGADFFPFYRPEDISRNRKIKNKDWETILPAQGDGGGIHDF